MIFVKNASAKTIAKNPLKIKNPGQAMPSWVCIVKKRLKQFVWSFAGKGGRAGDDAVNVVENAIARAFQGE